jgi:alkanesulfonate monooxygenase SsuD/methylene tetrahydromethanopterin reductase-like flavin-dependent oxidoreductase (luciferase family)
MAIWLGEPPYDQHGEYHSFSTARTLYPEIGQGIVVRPFQRPHPPIVYTAVSPHSAGITKAAERGWTGISSNYVQAHWVATHIPRFVEGRRNVGLPEDPTQWRIARSIFVADDRATAYRYAKSEDGPYGFYFQNIMRKIARGRGGLGLFKSAPDQPDGEVSVRHSLDTQVLAGTVDEVVDQILAFRDLVGPFGTLLYAGHDWADVPLARRSMELMASEVMPRVNKALGAAEAAD